MIHRLKGLVSSWLATSGVPLMDLDQSNSDVSSSLVKWAQIYVQTYGIDGFRIDASKHMPQDFQHHLCSTANTFCVGEVAGDDTAYAAEFQGPKAIDSVFGFGMMYAFQAVFTDQKSTMGTLSQKISLAASSYSVRPHPSPVSYDRVCELIVSGSNGDRSIP